MDKKDITRKQALKRLGGLALGPTFIPPVGMKMTANA
jgi:hypothetical protein